MSAGKKKKKTSFRLFFLDSLDNSDASCKEQWYTAVNRSLKIAGTGSGEFSETMWRLFKKIELTWV